MFIKIYTKLKEYLRKTRVKPREASYLFENKEIFNATDEELGNVIKEMAAKEIPNPIARDREVIRALVVSNIQNQRFIKLAFFPALLAQGTMKGKFENRRFSS